MAFANSLDPDQAWHYVRPDLHPNCLTLWRYSWKNFLKKVDFEKNLQTIKKHAKLASVQGVNFKKHFGTKSGHQNIHFQNGCRPQTA